MWESAPVLTGGLLRPNIRLSPNGKRLYRPDTLATSQVGHFTVHVASATVLSARHLVLLLTCCPGCPSLSVKL